MRIAFYAPLKAPDHPVPSGDRTMARLLVAALREGGHAVDLVSTVRSFLPVADPIAMDAVAAEAEREVRRLEARFAAEGAPDLWFTYHSHYKAPDLLGPALAARFGLPYAVAEASHAGKRAAGPWARWHAANAAAIRAADRHLCFTPRDAAGLMGLARPDSIVPLPPFIAAGAPAGAAPAPRAEGAVALVTVAMMRPGDKARSYAALAEALAGLEDRPAWRLTVIGDGPERAAVERLFAGLPPERLHWAGERDAAGVAALLARSDLYVWPGFGEAYGLAFLEAAAAGLPVLAMDCGGIGSVVEAGVTGLLTPAGDVGAFRAALAGLVADPAARARLGAAGARMACRERTVARAAERLSAALVPLVGAAERRRPRAIDAAAGLAYRVAMTDDWHPARDALDRAAAAGRTVRVWLRDDDCVAVTPALERLAGLCGAVRLPVLLATIPAGTEAGLVPWIARHPGFTPCQHGWAHADHAPQGERARELGGRPADTVLTELARGRVRLRDLFGPALSDILVPPWNRIDAALVPRLPAAGYAALSAFGPTPEASPLPRLDADLDIIDWRRGRIGRPPGELARKVADIVAGQDRLGILTHHLAHDAAAWTGLAELLNQLAAHPAVRFTDATSLLC